MRIKWSNELIIQTILNRHEKGKPLNYQEVVNDDEKLTGAARRCFGSWDKAMQAAGFKEEDYKNPTTKQEKWSREKITTRLKDHIEKGMDISPHEVQKYDSKLYASGVYYFGSWEKVIEHLDINYSQIKKTDDWSKEIVIEVIQDAYKSGADLSDNTVSALSPKLYGAANHYFRGWREAIEASGIDSDTIRRTREWSKEKISSLVSEAFINGVTLVQLDKLGILKAGDILNHFSNYEELYDTIGINSDEINRNISGNPIKNNVRHFRKKKNFSQEKLGRLVGRSHRWVSLIENEETGIRVDDAIKLARALNVTLDHLFNAGLPPIIRGVLEIPPGTKFGSLTVIKEVAKVGQFRMMLCECKCGNQKVYRLGNLRSGGTKSCGCSRKERRRIDKSLIGQTFGNLTVKDRLDDYPNNTISRWLCICVCGEETKALANNLKSGATRSCGCRGITRDSCLDDLIKIYDAHGIVTIVRLNELLDYDYTTLRKRFDRKPIKEVWKEVIDEHTKREAIKNL